MEPWCVRPQGCEGRGTPHARWCIDGAPREHRARLVGHERLELFLELLHSPKVAEAIGGGVLAPPGHAAEAALGPCRLERRLGLIGHLLGLLLKQREPLETFEVHLHCGVGGGAPG